MSNNQPLTVIELVIENRAGYIYISSVDVPGLHIWGDDPKKLCKKIVPAIKLLFKLNRGLDVEVLPASKPEEFPTPSDVCRDDHVADRYVMYPAAVA